VEALQRHSNTQSNWSICFFPRGTVVHVPGMHPHLQWNWILLLTMSRYRSDPNMIPDHWLDRSSPLAISQWPDTPAALAMPFPVPFCTLHVLLLLATQWPVTYPGQVAGGDGEPCGGPVVHSTTQSHCRVGWLSASRLGGQQFTSRGCTTLTIEPSSPVSNVSLQTALCQHIHWVRREKGATWFPCLYL
jgi:hypothetical protein